jgi:hypothetical protein
LKKSARRLRLPDFIGVGPPRTGTTWLDGLLRGRTCLPAGHETRFFDGRYNLGKETEFFSQNYDRGIEWYAAHFDHCSPAMPAGEFSPLYFASAVVRDRVAAHIPQCKVICTLREPVERLYSHYRHWVQIGAVKGPFALIVANHHALLSFTQYAANVRAWRQRFGAENVFIGIYEDSRSDRQGYVDRIFDFIGIPRFNLATIGWESERVRPADSIPSSRRRAARAVKMLTFLERRRFYRIAHFCIPLFEHFMRGGGSFPPLEPELEATLRRRFLPEVEQIEELLGRELPEWRGEPRPRSEGGFEIPAKSVADV